MSEQSVVLNAEVVGQGKDVLLLHGLFGMGSNLRGVANALAESFRVHSLDLRNHGGSPHCAVMNYSAMAADVASYMLSHNIDQGHVLGHSMGGKVAMQLALDKPELVDRLVVADISPVAYSANHDTVFAGLNAVDLTSVSSRREVGAILADYIEEPAVVQFLLRNLYRDDHKQYHWYMNVQNLQANYASIKAGLNAASIFEGEVLFIKGENSDYILPEHRENIVGLFPNARVKVIQNTGHWLHAEKPAAFNQQVLTFFSG